MAWARLSSARWPTYPCERRRHYSRENGGDGRTTALSPPGPLHPAEEIDGAAIETWVAQELHATNENLGLGSAAGLDPWHLDRLASLAARVDPVRVSDHAAFCRAPRVPGGGVLHGADLLPVAFTEASLVLVARQVMQVQERLRRPLLVENISAYVDRKSVV